MEVVARHYRTGQPVRVAWENGVYAVIEAVETTETSLPWVAPGLVDIQVNGFGGVDFNRPLASPNDWEQATDALYKFGCTHFLIALITNRRSVYAELVQSIEEHRRARPRNCLGYHFEGPFLNPEPGYHGAHCTDWMSAPRLDLFEEWQTLTRNRVRLVTLAPEVDFVAARKLIERAVSSGVRVSAGHSALMGEELERTMSWGLSAWTHLGNAAPNPTDKFRNVIFSALAQDNLFASLIPDGKHVPAPVFKVISRYLGERLLLTTDAMAGACAGPGRYSLCHMDIDVGDDGIARIPGQPFLAGSTLTPFEGVFYAAQMNGAPWQEMWDAFSVRPARWLGIKHGLELGNEASFCLLNPDPNPQLAATYSRGALASEN